MARQRPHAESDSARWAYGRRARRARHGRRMAARAVRRAHLRRLHLGARRDRQQVHGLGHAGSGGDAAGRRIPSDPNRVSRLWARRRGRRNQRCARNRGVAGKPWRRAGYGPGRRRGDWRRRPAGNHRARRFGRNRRKGFRDVEVERSGTGGPLVAATPSGRGRHRECGHRETGREPHAGAPRGSDAGTVQPNRTPVPHGATGRPRQSLAHATSCGSTATPRRHPPPLSPPPGGCHRRERHQKLQ
jgi:hypothetical protein